MSAKELPGGQSASCVQDLGNHGHTQSATYCGERSGGGSAEGCEGGGTEGLLNSLLISKS